jgi:hypothetical protein
MVVSISEVINKACELKTREEKVDWLRKNNSVPLRNILICMYDKQKIKFLLPNTPPPYKPSESHDVHGNLIREARKLKYIIEGMGGENVERIKREQHLYRDARICRPGDAELLCQMIQQKPMKGPYTKTNQRSIWSHYHRRQGQRVMAKKTRLDEEEYYDNWSDYKDHDSKRYDRKKQEIENARRQKSREKDSFFADSKE